MLAGERESTRQVTATCFSSREKCSPRTRFCPSTSDTSHSTRRSFSVGLLQGLGVIKPGLKEGEGLGWDPMRTSDLWLYGSLWRWKDNGATVLGLGPCPPLSLPPLQAESEPDFSLHLNPLGVHVIHLFCGATLVLPSLLILHCKQRINVALGIPFPFISLVELAERLKSSNTFGSSLS